MNKLHSSGLKLREVGELRLNAPLRYTLDVQQDEIIDRDVLVGVMEDVGPALECVGSMSVSK